MRDVVCAKVCKAVESVVGEDDEDTFRHKMTALQRFLNHGMSRFSIDAWHHALTKLHHPHPHQVAGRPLVAKLCGLEDLRALSREVMLQREGGSLREGNAQALKYLDNFLVALHCVREAKGCVANLHVFLYRYYYDPSQGRERSQLRSGKAVSRAGSVHVAGGLPGTSSSYHDSAQQFGILTLQQMSGTTGHKLRRTVADMQQILARWDRLMTEGEIRQEDLDAESQQDLQMLSGTAAFEPVLRLMPDIFAKFYKCLELLKQWWVLAHEIYPELPINRPPTPSSEEDTPEGRVSRVESDLKLSALKGTPLDQSYTDQAPVSEQLQKIEDNIQRKENTLQSLNDELKLLEERERYFESLAEAYEKVTAELEEQTRQRKELVIVREKETFPPQNQMMDAGATEMTSASKPHANAEDLNERVARAESEMQMLQFQQSLLKQDYMVQLEVRPSLIRFADDLRIKVGEDENSLVEDKMERIKLVTLAGEETVISNRSASPGHSYPALTPEEAPDASTEVDRAAERRQELTRLLDRPLREDTSASSMAGQTASVAAVARRRRQSFPAARKGDKPPPALPAITIHQAGQDTSTAPNSQSPRKSPRGPTTSSPQNAKSPQNSAKSPQNNAKSPQNNAKSPQNNAKSPQNNAKSPQVQQNISNTDSQHRTEPLFQRQAGKPQMNGAATEKASERRPNHMDQPVRRPRAKSDSHALKTEIKSVNVNPESSQRLKTTDVEKAQEKSLPKVRDGKSSPRARPDSDDSKFGNQAVSKKAKPASLLRKTSTAKSPDDAGRSAVTSKTAKSDDTQGFNKTVYKKPSKTDHTHSSKTDDAKSSKTVHPNSSTKSSKPDDSNRSKEAAKHSLATSQSSRVADTKKQTDVKPDKDKKDREKPLPKPTARHATDRSPRGPQQSPKEKDDDRKRHTASLKPLEKTLNKAMSQKSTEDDVKKDSNKSTLPPTKEDDKKASKITAPEIRKPRTSDDRGGVKSNHKLGDVKEIGKVTSQLPHSK
ncbi:hypothetical protein ACOMHN_016144 [Nucella lapillus]